MADGDTPDLTAAQPQGGDISGIAQSMGGGAPMVQGGAPAVNPNSPPTMSGRRPNILNLITGLIDPRKGTPAGQRVPSRLDVFENFLGNFMQSMSAGMQASGRGPGANLRAFGAAVQAPYQQDVQEFQQRQQAQEEQAKLKQTQVQTQRMQSSSPITLPNGQTMMIPNDQLKNVLGPLLNAQGRQAAAQTTGQYGLQREALKQQFEAGKVGKMVPGINPETNQPGYQLLSKFGESMGWVDHSVVPSLMARTSQTVQYMEDADGTIRALPKTTTRQPIIPGGKLQPTADSQMDTVDPKSSLKKKVPSLNGPPAASPGKPVMLGKSANDMVYGIDPKSNEMVATTRSDAAQRGLQITSNKVGAKEIMDDRAMSDRLVDVQTKMNRYQTMLDSVTEGDKKKMAYILNSDKFKLGMFGAEIPVDEINQMLAKSNIGDMTDAGKKALISYYNAREAINGYARVLSGSGHASDASMKLNLDALPSPVMPNSYVKDAIGQFGENIGILARRFPRFAGSPTPMDVQKQLKNATSNEPPDGVLKEGTETTFKNGQTWTLKKGEKVRIK